MNFYLRLLLFEIKRMLRFLPKLLAGALALCLITAVIAFGAVKLMYNTGDIDKVTIAISMPEGDIYTQWMMNIIDDMESVKELCRFEYTDESQVYEKVKNGTAFGGVVFPERFVQGIVRGENNPAKVITGRENSLEGRLFKELAVTGTNMLSDVQAGVYTVIDEYQKATGEQLKNNGDIVKNINMEYVDFILPRERYFEHKVYSATGELTTMEYYTAMGTVLWIMMFGVGLGGIVRQENRGLKDKLYSKGISAPIMYITKVIVVSLLYTILMCLLAMGVYIWGGIELSIGLMETVSLLLAIWLGSSIIVGVYTVFDSAVASALILFLGSIGMCFVSGGFIPTVFLPESVQSISGYMPTAVMAQAVGKVFTEEYNIADILRYVIMLLNVYVVLTVMYVLKTITGGVRR